MKRKIKDNILASTDFANTLAFTPNDLVSILKAIDELKSCEIALIDNLDGTQSLIIDDSSYQIIDAK